MIEQLITFDTAILAKEKGFFDLSVDGDVRISQQNLFGPDGHPFTLKEALGDYYDDVNLGNCYNRPTQSLLQKWLREAHKINIEIGRHDSYENFSLGVSEDNSVEEHHASLYHKTYEEALEKGLLIALILIK